MSLDFQWFLYLSSQYFTTQNILWSTQIMFIIETSEPVLNVIWVIFRVLFIILRMRAYHNLFLLASENRWICSFWTHNLSHQSSQNMGLSPFFSWWPYQNRPATKFACFLKRFCPYNNQALRRLVSFSCYSVSLAMFFFTHLLLNNPKHCLPCVIHILVVLQMGSLHTFVWTVRLFIFSHMFSVYQCHVECVISI